MITKTMSGVTVKSADAGTVTAAFSQFNVKDHDGDVTLPDALTDGQEVRISAFNHKSWQGELPVGKGVIRVDAEKGWAYMDGEFFMDTPHGAATFNTVKGLGDLMEWSYSLHDVQKEDGMWEGEEATILRKINVHEVSPVLKGAGIGTHTVAIKSDGKFSDHASTVIAAVAEFSERTRGVIAYREEQGKSAVSDELADQIKTLSDLIADLSTVVPDPTTNEGEGDDLPNVLEQYVMAQVAARHQTIGV